MNLLTSSLSTSFSVPSSPSWAHGGMETDATISDETDKRIGLNFCLLFLNDLYEHHCYRKYSDKLDESSEGFFWEEFYHTDSEQGSDSYYREHQEVQRKRAPVDVVPGKDLERNFQQIDNEEEPGVNADVFHLSPAEYRREINGTAK